MEKVTGYTNLYRRNATYYFRVRVPKDILKTFGKREIKFSLGTKDKTKAVSMWRIASTKVELEFSQHRKAIELQSRPAQDTITEDKLKFIHDLYFHYLLDEDNETRLHGFDRGQQPEEPLPTFEEYKGDTEALIKVTRKDYAQGGAGVFFEGEAEEVLSWDGVEINLKRDSLAFKKVVRTPQEATLRARESTQSRNEGRIVDTPAEPLSPISDSPVDSGGLLLSEVMEEWIRDKERSSWTPKTVKEHRAAVESFIGMCGDKPFNHYIKADARAFKDALLTIPTNWKRRGELKGLNLRQAATKAASLGIPSMAPKNAKKKFQFVGNLWRWLAGNYDEQDSNIFEGISIKVNSDSRNERHPFTIDELNTIFSAPVYTGCMSESRWSDEGSISLKDTAKHWAPLIALYSGARLGEILQLHVSDIKEEEGVHYFDINAGDEKTLKTRSSIRSIPIHQTLIDAGFLDLVSSREVRGVTRVFPDVPLCSDGSYTAAFSKYFSRFLESLSIKHDKNSFHSFRHTFEDACRENDVPKEIMDTLQGHAEQGMSGRYGSGYSLQKLNEGLQKVGYGGLELSTLISKSI